MPKEKLHRKNKDIEEGIYAAALTPMHADLACNVQELARHCLDLIQRGCQGVVLFGTTGEGPSFSLKERVKALGKVIEQGIDPQKIILANGASAIPESIELARASLRWNNAAFLAAPPSFFKNVSEEGIIAYYREIIERVADPSFRLIVYHIPQFTGVPITLNIVKSLHREFPDTVIGIKETEGNLEFAKQIIEALPNLHVFVGNEKNIIEAASLGASGSICGMANLYPERICSLYQQGKKALCPNPREMDAFFEAMRDYPFIAAFKALMEHKKGSAWHALRPPLMPLSGKQRQDFIARIEISEKC